MKYYFLYKLYISILTYQVFSYEESANYTDYYVLAREINGNCTVNDLVALSDSPSSILATWEPPDINCGTVVQYRIEWYSKDISDSAMTPFTNYTVADLIPCSNSYVITLSTEFSNAHAPSGDYSSVDESTLIDVPGEPTNLACVAVSTTEVLVTWVGPDYVSNPCPVDSYLVHTESKSLRNDSANNTMDFFSLCETTHSLLLTNLDPYTSYDIFVASNNTAGTSDNVTCSVDTVQEAPGPPEEVIAIPVSTTSLLITWLEPQYVPGEIIQYWVTAYDKINEPITVNTGSPVTSLTMENLVNCTQYIVTVVGETAGGKGNSSNPAGATTYGNLNYSSPKCLESDNQSVNVSWTIYSNICDSFEETMIVVWERTSLWGEMINNTAMGSDQTNDTSYNIDDFYYYSKYVISIANLGNEETHKSCPDFVTSQAAPGPPEEVIAIPVSTTSLLITWLEPQYVPGEIIQYWVTASDKINEPITVNTGSPDTSLIMENLVNCTQYIVTVVGETAGGKGNSSNPAGASTYGYISHSDPVCLEVDQYINVNWTIFERSCDSLDTISVFWKRTFLAGEIGGTTAAGEGESNGTYFVIEDFYFYSTYDIAITVANNEVINKSCPQLTTSQGPPEPPEDVEAILGSTYPYSSMLILWNPPKIWNGIINEYWVLISDQSNFTRPVVVGVNSTIVTIRVLNECTNYSIQVTAETEGGNGSYSDPIYSATEGFLNFTDPYCFVSGESIVVSWSSFSNCESTDKIEVSWYGIILWPSQGSIYGSRIPDTNYYVIEGNDFHFYTTYDIHLRSIYSLQSDSKYCPQITTPQAAPTAPNFLGIESSDSTSLTLSWYQPDKINGIISSYKISGSDIDDIYASPVYYYVNRYTVTGLQRKTNYSFTVSAITGNGAYVGPPAETSGNTSKMGSGIVAGIVLAVVALLALMIFVLYFMFFVKK